MFYALTGSYQQAVDVETVFLVLNGLLTPASLTIQISAIGLHGNLGKKSAVLRVDIGSFRGFFPTKGVRSIPLNLVAMDTEPNAISLSWSAPIDRIGLMASGMFLC